MSGGYYFWLGREADSICTIEVEWDDERDCFVRIPRARLEGETR